MNNPTTLVKEFRNNILMKTLACLAKPTASIAMKTETISKQVVSILFFSLKGIRIEF
jgi:hypothetical protein